MLTLDTRADYQTLLDAAVLDGGDAAAIVYLATDAEPITVTRGVFAETVRSGSGI
ncbi:MAG: hypothetical protein AAF125_22750 [Chloroflexota bacterium]